MKKRPEGLELSHHGAFGEPAALSDQVLFLCGGLGLLQFNNAVFRDRDAFYVGCSTKTFTWYLGLIVPLPERFCATLEAYILCFNGVFGANTD